MQFRPLAFSLVLLLTAVSCQQIAGNYFNGKPDSLSTDTLEKHHHHVDANHYMNSSEFEELVQRFEDPNRDPWQQPELVIKKLGNLHGKTVADIGSGTGYFAFRIAKTAKKVIAIDIDERFLDYIINKMENTDSLHDLNIEPRITQPDDPSLAAGETDLVLLVNTYHHINDRPEYFSKVKEALRTGGVLAIVDFRKEEMPVGPPVEHKLSAEEVRDELKLAGFSRFDIDNSSLQYQFILLAN
ncbi:MAG: class I SAM-dependent methyltransferase [Bacteroidia bacterium]|nr:class I SAM-dependent methyltransferase [Bacteroidia bacterium]